jgi:ribosomal-protein-alanine N-acetyltransferase
MPDLKIFPMSFAELEEVMEIENFSFPKPWHKSQFRKELMNPMSFSFVGKVLYKGKLKLVSYIVFWLLPGEAHILNIVVHPEFLRCGIATELMSFAMVNMQEMGVKDVFLEVRRSNIAANRLYKALGFEEVGIRRGYYENGENAIVMHYELAPA